MRAGDEEAESSQADVVVPQFSMALVLYFSPEKRVSLSLGPWPSYPYLIDNHTDCVSSPGLPTPLPWAFPKHLSCLGLWGRASSSGFQIQNDICPNTFIFPTAHPVGALTLLKTPFAVV